MENHATHLIMGSEVVALLDRFACDWEAFLADRVASFIQFHGHVPTQLTILNRRGIVVTETRRKFLEDLYYRVAWPD